MNESQNIEQNTPDTKESILKIPLISSPETINLVYGDKISGDSLTLGLFIKWGHD